MTIRSPQVRVHGGRSGSLGVAAGHFLLLLALLPLLVSASNPGIKETLKPYHDLVIYSFAMAAAFFLELPDPLRAWTATGLGLCAGGAITRLPLPALQGLPPMLSPGLHLLGWAFLGMSFLFWASRTLGVPLQAGSGPTTAGSVQVLTGQVQVVSATPPGLSTYTPAPQPAVAAPPHVAQLTAPTPVPSQPSSGGGHVVGGNPFNLNVAAPMPTVRGRTMEKTRVDVEDGSTEVDTRLNDMKKDLEFMEELDRGLMACVPSIVAILSASSLRVKDCNEQFREALRLAPDEESGKGIDQLLPNSELIKLLQDCRGQRGVKELFFTQHIKKIGDRRFHARIFGGVEGLVILSMTEVVETGPSQESRLPKTQIINVQSEKLQIAGGMFEDMERQIDPMLDGLANNLGTICTMPEIQGRLRESLESCRGQTLGVRNVIRTFRRFAEQHLEVADRIELLPVVEAALDPKAYPFDLMGISVVKDFGTAQPLVEVNEKQLRQAFINLFTNAFEAIRRRGPTGQVLVRVWTEAGKARVAITDSGDGVPPEQLPNIFKGLVSAKGGAAMGLMSAQRIVAGAKGAIRASSTQGQGSTFTVELPQV